MKKLEYQGPPGHMPGIPGHFEVGQRFKPGELPPETEAALKAQGWLKQVDEKGGDK